MTAVQKISESAFSYRGVVWPWPFAEIAQWPVDHWWCNSHQPGRILSPQGFSVAGVTKLSSQRTY